eukprot:403357386
MESSQKEIILITGITGYVGAWVGKYFVDNCLPQYRIRATVRSLTNKKKLDPLRNDYGADLFDQIEFVEADLNDKQSMHNAVKGCKYVIHVASPIPGQVQPTEQQMIESTTTGTLAILESALHNKVKKLIITLSMVTMFGGNFKGTGVPGNISTYDENDFAPLQGADSYTKSKIHQEHVIMDFQKKNPGKLDIVTIHPSLVIGPTIIAERNSSNDLIAKLMNREMPGVINLCLPLVDVRDVAQAHLVAFQKDVKHKRILLHQDSASLTLIGDVLAQEFNKQGYRVPTRRLGRCMLRLAACFDPSVRMIIHLVDAQILGRNDISRQELGIKYNIPIQASLIEMGYSLIEKGIVQDKRKKK